MLTPLSFLINLSLKAISSDTPGGSNSNIHIFFSRVVENNYKQRVKIALHTSHKWFEETGRDVILSVENTLLTLCQKSLSEIYLKLSKGMFLSEIMFCS